MRTTDTLAYARDGQAETGAGWGAGEAVLGRFRLERLLGTGGFGAVWRAHDEHLRRPVAVKVIPRSAAAGARTRREALAAARLNHPAIVALYEEGEDERALYLVSELVEGRTLADLETDGALSDRAVVRIGMALCDALLHAHANGVIHRDVKPQNVIVPRRGRRSGGATVGSGGSEGSRGTASGDGGGRGGAVAPAKLADFGVAHLIGDEPLTHTGDVLGTLAYMAPEQAGGRRADAPADLYALGLLLYEAFAGVNPVRAGTPAATARRIGRALPPLRRLRRDLPDGLCAALDRAVRPRPPERGTLDELRSTLDAAAGEVEDGDGVLPVAAPLVLLPARAPARVLAGLAAGGLVAVALTLAGPPAPVPPAPAALAVAAVVAVLPRAGWLAAAGLVVAWLAGPRPGEALLLAAGLAAPPLMLPRRGGWWSLPALAPLLGLLGLAPAYCALAALGPGARARAALGAAGLWWLCLTEALLGRDLHLGRLSGPPGSAAVLASTGQAADALWSLASSGEVIAAAPWALAAAALPLLISRGGLIAAALGAVAWAAALALATGALAGALALPDPRGALAGALVGGILALVARVLREPSGARPAPLPTA